MSEKRDGPTVSRCSTCERPIIWAKSPAGAALPLDARPAVMYVLEGDQAVAVRPVPEADRPWLFEADGEGARANEPKTYVSHFLTCPQATAHSKRGKELGLEPPEPVESAQESLL